MLYAGVVLGLPVEGPFDYIVPGGLEKNIKAGMRAWVSLGTRKMLGYVVKISRKSPIKNLKKILATPDNCPVLDSNMLLFTKKLSEYYCCSWGEAIETALPEGIRKGRRLPDTGAALTRRREGVREVMLIHDLDGGSRWEVYLEEIKKALAGNGSVIMLLPDLPSVLKMAEIIKIRFAILPTILYRSEPKELDSWSQIKSGKSKIILGMRSSIFAPAVNLSLIIIEDESNSIYKQDQVPHYNAREAAFMRSGIEKTKLILGSFAPSLESFYLARKNKIKYTALSSKNQTPEVKIIDMKHLSYADRKGKAIFSKYLVDSVYASLGLKEKVLLLLNRKGFATLSSCHSCGVILKCPRCSINLVYHFKPNSLNCHYCNFKMKLPEICPDCNAGYIKFSGMGTEKIESELARIFPQARIKRLETAEKLDLQEADIFVSTSSIIKKTDKAFELVGVLGIDNTLNRVDFRASEKVFSILTGLFELAKKRIVIQTSLPSHHSFLAIAGKDAGLFYKAELKQRRQLDFPPYKHMAFIKLRGRNEDKVRESAGAFFNKLKDANADRHIRIVSVNPGEPLKMRGNFYWRILLIFDSVNKIKTFLKIHLKNFTHSGIIVTVDIDPV